MGTCVMGLWSGYWCQVIEDIKSCYLEVKATKLDKWLRSYGHLKINIKQEDNIDKIDISCPDQILKNWPLQK